MQIDVQLHVKVAVFPYLDHGYVPLLVVQDDRLLGVVRLDAIGALHAHPCCDGDKNNKECDEERKNTGENSTTFEKSNG